MVSPYQNEVLQFEQTHFLAEGFSTLMTVLQPPPSTAATIAGADEGDSDAAVAVAVGAAPGVDKAGGEAEDAAAYTDAVPTLAPTTGTPTPPFPGQKRS